MPRSPDRGGEATETYYTERTKDFETPTPVRAAYLLGRCPDGGSEAEDKARAKVADVIRRVKGGEDFGKLAAEVSEDPGSKTKGGELGWVKKGEMVPQFEEALFGLKQGGITAEPVRTPFGYHAIKVFEAKAESRKRSARWRRRFASGSRGGGGHGGAAKADEVRRRCRRHGLHGRGKGGVAPVEDTLARSSVRCLGGHDA